MKTKSFIRQIGLIILSLVVLNSFGYSKNNKATLSEKIYIQRLNKLLSNYNMQNFKQMSKDSYAVGENVAISFVLDDNQKINGFILALRPYKNTNDNLKLLYYATISVVALGSDKTTPKYNKKVLHLLGFKGDFRKLLGGKKYDFSYLNNPKYKITSTFSKLIGFLITADIEK